MATDDLTRRIEELESQAAFQDELHARLNEVVARQDREIVELRRLVAKLSESIAALESSAPGAQPDPADEVPPHY